MKKPQGRAKRQPHGHKRHSPVLKESLPAMRYGSHPVVSDTRDFEEHVFFGSTMMPKDLPPRLNRAPGKIKNQGATNFCTAFATSSAAEFHEGIELSPEYQAALIGMRSGYPILGGADPRKALSAGISPGFLPQHDAPFSLADHPDTFLADWHNWKAPLELLTYVQAQRSYFRIDTGPFDPYDNIRMALARGKDENSVGIPFTQWRGEWNEAPKGFVSDFGSQVVGFHAYVYLDYDITYKNTEVLVVQNSCGPNYGDGGIQYFERDVINAIYTKEPVGSAAYMYRDLSPEVVRQLNKPLIGPLLRWLRQYYPNIV